MLHVLKTEYLGDYTLLCSFDNGEIREVDLTPIQKIPGISRPSRHVKFSRVWSLKYYFSVERS